jgi:hypothetical protein
MSSETDFSGRLLAGWIAGAVVVFAVSLYLMGGGEVSGPESTGASTFSRSAVGHAGIADVLQRLGIAVVKSRYNSLEKLAPRSVLVIAEPRPGQQSEEAIRTLLKADRILLVLPKWTGLPSEQSPGWIREVRLRSTSEAASPCCAARRGGPGERRDEMDEQSVRRRPEPGGTGAIGARRRPAAGHRDRPGHAGWRRRRSQSPNLGPL